MFKELFTEKIIMDARKWKKFAKTIQQAANTKKIKLDQIRVINNSSIEILGAAEELETLRDEVLIHFISSNMRTTLSYTSADNKSGTPILSIYEV